MKKLVLAALVAALVVIPAATGASSQFKAKPFTFVGTAAECAPFPAGSNIVTGAWVTNAGLPDAGNSDHALFLQKNGPTADCSSAGAVIDGVSGITLSELGFDYKLGGHCGAGAPRFNVTTTDGVLHFAGCQAATPTTTLTDSRGATWQRVRIDPNNAAQWFPTPPGSTPVASIAILFDEGTDTGPDFTGQVFLDNIDINGTLIGKPGNA